MTACPSCQKALDDPAAAFCPYCGADVPKKAATGGAAPGFDLEVQRARFVINQRCLVKFRVRKTSGPRVRLQVNAGIEQHAFEENVAFVPAAKLDRPAQFSFAFTPKTAGEFRIDDLVVVAMSEEDAAAAWAYRLGDDELSLRVSATDGGTSGVFYSIKVQEMYGSDIKMEDRPKPAPVDAEWQAIPLVLDEEKTEALRRPQPKVAPKVEAPPPRPIPMVESKVSAPPPAPVPVPAPVPGVEPAAGRMSCPYCAESIPTGTSTCPICATSLVAQPARPQPPRPAAPAAQPPPAVAPVTSDYTTRGVVCLALTLFCLIGFIPAFFFMIQAAAEKSKTGVSPKGRELLLVAFWLGLFYFGGTILYLVMIAAGNNF